MAILLFEGDLRLRVWTQPLDCPTLALASHVLQDAVAEHQRDRHQFLRLVGGLAEHMALVACANVPRVSAVVHPVSDLRGLLVDAHFES